MVDLFHIREFQFYDAFQGYSNPPAQDLEEWTCQAFGRHTKRRILRAYIEEISRSGGRSWLYLQAAATDPGDTQLQQGFQLTGQHVVDGRPLLDAVAPNIEWAEKIAPRWADWAAEMGFSGIHWDTLGKFSPTMAQYTDLPGFLRAAKPIVMSRGLEQTANFVDGFGWDPALIDPKAMPDGRTISFPYWETWSLPDQEDFFFIEVAPPPQGGGVFVCYPGKSPSHEGEFQNTAFAGIWPLDLMISRWIKARRSGNAYLAVGDGIHHLETQYFPANAPIDDTDVAKIRRQVFGLNTGKADFLTRFDPKEVPTTTTEAPSTSTTQATSTPATTTLPATTTQATTTTLATTTPKAVCGSPQPQDNCTAAVHWAMQHGIYEHPEWYKGLTAEASFDDFQLNLHHKGLEGCLRPCEPGEVPVLQRLPMAQSATQSAAQSAAASPVPAPAPPIMPTPVPTPMATGAPQGALCEDGLDDWTIRTQWSLKKQQWCCEVVRRGCLDPATAQVAAFPAAAAYPAAGVYPAPAAYVAPAPYSGYGALEAMPAPIDAAYGTAMPAPIDPAYGTVAPAANTALFSVRSALRESWRTAGPWEKFEVPLTCISAVAGIAALTALVAASHSAPRGMPLTTLVAGYGVGRRSLHRSLQDEDSEALSSTAPLVSRPEVAGVHGAEAGFLIPL